MAHYVYHQVLFTLGKEYQAHTENLKLNYVNCQWQNYQKEVCEVEILVAPGEIARAFDGDTTARDFIFMNFTYYLMNSFNPSVIS